MPARTLYVLVPPSPLFAAHWSFFVPDAIEASINDSTRKEPTSGRRIHVSGDRLNGFVLEIIRGYDVSKHRAVGSRQYAVGITRTSHLGHQGTFPGTLTGCEDKDEDEGGGWVDNCPRDDFERVCVEVEAPGPSLRRVNEGKEAHRGTAGRVEPRDCQWWIAEVVKELTRRGILEALHPVGSEEATKTPSQRVAALPVH